MSRPTAGGQQLVLTERRGDYVILTINRPEKRNAMNMAAQQALRTALRENEDAKVVIITGTDGSFCAGVDLAEARAADAGRLAQARRGTENWFLAQEKIRQHPAVFIAAVNGYALGGGLTLVNNCELAVASESAQFGMPEMSFGSFPGLAGPATLYRILPKHAAELIFTCRRIDSQTALEWGLVNQVVRPGDLMASACSLAERICEFDAVALAYGKRAYHDVLRMNWDEGIRYGIGASALIGTRSTSRSQALKSFAEGGRSSGQGRETTTFGDR